MDKNLYKENEELKAKIKAFEKYLPKRIVEKIHTNPYNVRVEGERRFVTILFGDVSGFTALSERLDPEGVIKVINKYFNKMLYIVEKYGGDVDKFVGDAIMVVFGAPVAHKDDPERAVRAALEMQEAIETIEPVFAKGEYIKVRMSIGINTGEIVALNMGTDERMEYTVMGDNVNLSARLEAVANATEVIISDRTYKFVKDVFDFEILEPVMVKGKKDPIPIFKALNIKKKISSDKDFPIIGYEDKLKKIEKIIIDAQINNNFSIKIFGKEGTGKSKITDFIYDKIDRKNLELIIFKGESFFKDTPFYPIKSSIEEILKIKKNDSKEIIKEKIDNYLSEDARYGLYFLFDILDIKDMQQNELINGIVSSIEDIIRIKIGTEKLVLSFEDLHYFDNNSKQIIQNLFSNNQLNKSLSFVFTSRDKINLKTKLKINTKNLNKNFIDLLIKSRLKNNISTKLKEFVFDKTNGNPLYTVELLKFLVDNNLLKGNKELTIKDDSMNIVPDSLKSVFLEKIDKLNEEYKIFLQYSSILGEVFEKSYLNNVFKYEKGIVEDNLKYLEENGYLQFLGSDKYRFPSQIFHNAIYNSLMINKRQEFHNNIASYLEKFDYENNLDYLRNIAKHYDYAENEKAGIFLHKIGLSDKKYFAYNEAINNLDKAKNYYINQKKYDKYCDILLDIVSIYLIIGKMKEALKLLNEKKKYFKQDNNRIMYYNFMGIIHERMGKMEDAEKFYKKSLKIAENISDLNAISKLNNQLGILFTVKGNYAEALKFFNRALNINIKNENTKSIGLQYANIGRIYGYMGDNDNAIKYFNMAIDIQEKIEDENGKLASLINLGFIYDSAGNYDKAISIYNNALEIAKKIGKKSEQAKILNNLGTILFATGNIKEALENFNIIDKIYSEMNDIKGLAEVKVNIAEIEMLRGYFKNAKKYFEDADKLCLECNHIHLQIYASIYFANTLLFLGYIEKAEQILYNALKNSEKMNIPDFIIMAKNILGKLLGIMGDIDKEKELVTQAYNLAKDIKNPELIFSTLMTLVKAHIEIGEYENAISKGEYIVKFARENNNEILLSDILASFADIYQKNNDITHLSEIVNEAFDIASKTDNLLSKMRNQIIISRFYFLIEDITSCESSLKQAENYSLKTGSIEHIIMVYNLFAEMYNKSGNVQLRNDAKLKCINSIEKYIDFAGNKYFNDIIHKRGFIKYFEDYIISLFDIYDVEYIKEHLKSHNTSIIQIAIKNLKTKKLLPKNLLNKIK